MYSTKQHLKPIYEAMAQIYEKEDEPDRRGIFGGRVPPQKEDEPETLGGKAGLLAGRLGGGYAGMLGGGQVGSLAGSLIGAGAAALIPSLRGDLTVGGTKGGRPIEYNFPIAPLVGAGIGNLVGGIYGGARGIAAGGRLARLAATGDHRLESEKRKEKERKEA